MRVAFNEQELRTQDKEVWQSQLFIKKTFIIVFLAGVAYYFSALISLSLKFPSSNISIIWLPGAILLSILLLTPFRQWWLVIFGGFIGCLLSQGGDALQSLTLPLYLNDCLTAISAAVFIRRFQEAQKSFDNLRNAVIFVAFGAVLPPLVTAFALTATGVLLSVRNGFWFPWQLTLFSNVLAVLVLVPTVITLGKKRGNFLKSVSKKRAFEAIFVATGLLVTTIMGFKEPLVVRPFAGIFLLAALLFVFWAAVRFGSSGSAAAIFICAWAAILTHLQLNGSLIPEFTAVTLKLQIFIMVAAFFAIILSAVTEEQQQIEESLTEIKKRYELATAAGEVQIWDVDLETGEMHFTPSFEKLSGTKGGWTREEWHRHIHPDDKESVSLYLKNAMQFQGTDEAKGNVQLPELEHRVIAEDGSIHWFAVRGTILRAKSGKPHRIVGTVADITERKQAAEKLTDEKNFSQTLLESLPGIFYLFDSNGRFLRWNKNFECVTGYNSDEIAQMHPLDFFVGEDVRLIEREIKNVFDCGESTAKADFVLKDKSKIPYFFTGRSLSFDGKMCLVGMGVDTSELKETSQALSDSQYLIQQTTNTIPSILYVYDLNDYLNLYVSEYVQNILGYSPEEIRNLQNSLREVLMHPDDMLHLPSHTQRIKRLKDGEVFEWEFRLRRKCGEWRWICTREIVFKRNGKNEPTQILGVANDVTERRVSEEALRQSEEFNRRIIESSDDCIKILDIEGNLLYVNSKGLELLELNDSSSCISSSWADFWSGTYKESAQGAIEQAKAGNVGRFQGHCPTFQGTSKWWDVIVTPILNAQEEIERILVVSRDITPTKQAQEELRKSEERYRAIVETQTELVCRYLPDGTLTFVNEAYCQCFNKTREELIGTKFFRLNPSSKRITEHQQIKSPVESSRPELIEYEILKENGEISCQQWIDRVIVDSDGKVVEIQGIGRDITEQKQIERELIESEKKFKRQYQNLPLPTITWQKAGNDLILIDYNEATSEKTDGKIKELLGSKASELYQDRSHVLEPMQHCMAEKTTLSYEMWYRLITTGKERYFKIHSAYVSPDMLVEHVEDFTERKQAEDALQASEERYRAVVETQTELICRFLPDGTLTFVNEAYCRYFGKTREQLIDSNLFKLIPEHERDRAQDHIRLLAENPGTAVIEHEVLKVNGEIGWQQWTDKVIVNSNGEVLEMQGIGRDITEQKRAQLALEKSEELFRTLVNDLQVGVLIQDADAKILLFNQSALKFLGLDRDQLIGKTSFDPDWNVIHEDGSPFPGETHPVPQAIKTTQPVKSVVMGVYRPAKKDRVWLHVDAVPQIDANGNLIQVICTFTDITEQKRSIEALIESEGRYRRIVNTAYEGIWIVDSNTITTYVNQRMAEMLGCEIRDMIGRSADEFLDDELKPGLKEKLRLRMQGISEKYDLRFRKKDGSPMWGIVSATPIKDKTGKFIGSLSLVTDITDRKQTEDALQQLTTRLLQLQDEERRHIARELHDQTAQNLGVLSINLSSLKRLIREAENEKVEELLTKSSELVKESLQEVRTLSYLLHPPMLDEIGFLSAAEWYIQGFVERSGIKVDFLFDEIERLPAEIETTLYRVLQESLTNINRHSNSKTASIKLYKENQNITLKIEDHGSGIKAKKPAKHNEDAPVGVGILGMKQRLQQLGGQLEIKSDKNGTTVIATVPLKRRSINDKDFDS